MPYLDLLRESREAGAIAGPPNGVSVLPQGINAEPGKTLAHPWHGRIVESPKGRLIWTDGYRAARTSAGWWT